MTDKDKKIAELELQVKRLSDANYVLADDCFRYSSETEDMRKQNELLLREARAHRGTNEYLTSERDRLQKAVRKYKQASKFAPSDEYLEQLSKTQALVEQERQYAEELKRKLYSVIQNISELRGKIRSADAEIGQVLQELFGETSEELLAPIKFDDLPVRAANALRNDRVSTYGDLLDKTQADLLRAPNFGRKSLVKIKEHLRKEVPLPMLIENGWA